MKKNSTAKKSPQALSNTKKNRIREVAARQRLTIGLDLGDRTSRYYILDEAGEVVSESQLPTTKAGLSSMFEKMPSSRIALEVGTHSPWVSRHLAGMGHEVIVANAHQVKLITQSVHKNDQIDAEQLARLARVDPKLLSPIRHRGPAAQADLAVIRARAELMEAFWPPSTASSAPLSTPQCSPFSLVGSQSFLLPALDDGGILICGGDSLVWTAPP
jgi:transposase